MESIKADEVYLGGTDEKKEGKWLWAGRKNHPKTEDTDIAMGLQAKRWLGGINVNCILVKIISLNSTLY